MYINQAVNAHKNNEFKLASQFYAKALENKEYSEVLFQNYGALKRELGEDAQAIELYQIGLNKFPQSIKILHNYANLLRANFPVKSLGLYLKIIRLSYAAGEYNDPKIFINVIEVLENLKCYSLAYSFCKLSIDLQQSPSALLALLRIVSRASFSFLHSSDINTLVVDSKNHIDSFTELEKTEFFFAVAWLNLEANNVNSARNNLDKANACLSHIFNSSMSYSEEDVDKASNLRNTYSWNMSCLLLPQQEFSEGWRLFEYGLVANAKGKQKWQRALLKPFTDDQLPLWRGESLSGKNLLLLEEQAVGDVMQFLTLLPYLIREAKHICILLNPRLIPIYKRSLSKYILNSDISLVTYEDVFSGSLSHADFHYQSPVGSVCRHRFTDISKYGSSGFRLLSNSELSFKLRERYIHHKSIKAKKIVGISWRGGGRADRIKQKSLSPELFSNLLKNNPGIRFVSLQYGESKNTVESWIEDDIDVLHDDEINPLKDMDSWLSQVAACDAVLSVANTTIHGSGGLDIPTMCLLSQHSDWRWLKDPRIKRSYWYPSVCIAREHPELGWKTAFESVVEWFSTGMPYPTGLNRL